MTDTNNEGERKPANIITYPAGLATAVALMLLAFTIPDAVLQATVLVLGGITLLFCGIQLAFRIGKSVGYTLTSTLTIALLFTLIMFWRGHQRINQLELELEQYVTASIQRNYLPFPQVYQLSVDDYVNDEELLSLLDRKELGELTHLYLRSDHLTEVILPNVQAMESLEYVLIESPKISEAAISELRQSRPEISIIVPANTFASE